MAITRILAQLEKNTNKQFYLLIVKQLINPLFQKSPIECEEIGIVSKQSHYITFIPKNSLFFLMDTFITSINVLIILSGLQ